MQHHRQQLHLYRFELRRRAQRDSRSTSSRTSGQPAQQRHRQNSGRSRGFCHREELQRELS
uniref:Uncharacterized protein n=1 Tax=Macrostomum lignano TaxID=282301 RepID=A0A1I8JJA7_9PLAT